MRVYIAGPYTNGDTEANVLAAMEVADQVLTAGHTPFLPHLFHFWHRVFPHEYQAWTDMDMEWLSLCEALIRLPGESSGADAEVKLADELGIRVYELEYLELEAVLPDLGPGPLPTIRIVKR